MNDDTILLLGGLAIGGIFLYQTLGKDLKDTGAGIATGVQALGDTTKTIGGSVSDVLSVTNPIKAATSKGVEYISAIPSPQVTGKALSNFMDYFFLGKGDYSTTKNNATANVRSSPTIDYVTPIQRLLNAGAFDKYLTPPTLKYSAPAVETTSSAVRAITSSASSTAGKNISKKSTTYRAPAYSSGSRSSSGYIGRSNVIFKR